MEQSSKDGATWGHRSRVPPDFAEEFVPHIEHSEVARELGENARRLAMTDYTWVAAIVLGKPLVSAMGRQLLEDCAEIDFSRLAGR